MTPDEIAAWEMNAARGWPSLRTEAQNGWILRLSDGYTKRANSVHPLGGTTGSEVSRIEAAESVYQEAGLPTLFKMPQHPFWQPLERLLDDRGYTIDSPSRVLSTALSTLAEPNVPEVTVAQKFSTPWLQTFFEANGVEEGHQAAARAIVTKVERPLVGWVKIQGRTVAWGYVAVVDDQAWLYDLVVLPEARRQGWARALIQTLYSLARKAGAQTACLQVLEDNPGANALYEGMGFREAYRYHYRRGRP